MNRLRKTGLTIDDPLASAATSASVAGQEEERAASAVPARVIRARPSTNDKAPARRPSSTLGASVAPTRSAARPAARPSTMSAQSDEPWRSWSGLTRVASYRLPDELLAELAATATRLQLPVGLLVTAAITELLDQRDDTMHGLVDRADDARIHGRRAARRLLS
jgi:hypothetical protein